MMENKRHGVAKCIIGRLLVLNKHLLKINKVAKDGWLLVLLGHTLDCPRAIKNYRSPVIKMNALIHCHNQLF